METACTQEYPDMSVAMEIAGNPLVIGIVIMAIIWVVVIYGSEILNKNVQ